MLLCIFALCSCHTIKSVLLSLIHLWGPNQGLLLAWASLETSRQILISCSLYQNSDNSYAPLFFYCFLFKEARSPVTAVLVARGSKQLQIGHEYMDPSSAKSTNRGCPCRIGQNLARKFPSPFSVLYLLSLSSFSNIFSKENYQLLASRLPFQVPDTACKGRVWYPLPAKVKSECNYCG